MAMVAGGDEQLRLQAGALEWFWKENREVLRHHQPARQQETWRPGSASVQACGAAK
jgi:hypothetical protein